MTELVLVQGAANKISNCRANEHEANSIDCCLRDGGRRPVASCCLADIEKKIGDTYDLHSIASVHWVSAHMISADPSNPQVAAATRPSCSRQISPPANKLLVFPTWQV